MELYKIEVDFKDGSFAMYGIWADSMTDAREKFEDSVCWLPSFKGAKWRIDGSTGITIIAK